MVGSKNTILFSFDSQSLSISAVWSPLLLHIISLCPGPNSSASEIRCPWSLALACVMPYWGAITRYDKATSALQEYRFSCNNLEQRKKSTGKKPQQYSMCQCSGWWKAGSSDENPETVLYLALRHWGDLHFRNPLARWEKGFQSKRKKWQKLGVKTHLV